MTKRFYSIFLSPLLLLPLSIIVLSMVLNTSFAANQDNLLKPDVAFKPSLTEITSDKITASWDIADGYYLYRKRFSFKSNSPGITLGTPVFPKGKIKEDPGFGKMEIYRHRVAVEIPLIRNNPGANKLSLKTVSQGCADIGVCYPPQKKTLTLGLSANVSSAPASMPAKKPMNLAQELGITGLNNANAPLPPDQAFALDVIARDQQTLNAHWNITPGHYLYRNKIHFKLEPESDAVTIGKIKLPEGKTEHDEYFGDVVIYTQDFDVLVPLIINGQKAPETIKLKTTYQGCSKLTGICYPPQTRTQKINLASAKAAPPKKATAGRGENPRRLAETDSGALNQTKRVSFSKPKEKFSTGNEWLDQSLNSDNFLLILLTTLGAGLALAFTACMYPMIPILSSIIVGHGKEVSTFKGFSLSAIYVVSLAVTFGIIGAITASVAGGIGIQAYFQNPWVLSAFALLFIVLAFSMFGFYDIQVPAVLQNKLSSISNNQKGGSLIGVAIMGALSALIIGPCGGPILAAILSYAALSASLYKGFLAMFALGLGMGLPLLIVGAGGGKLLPRAGTWMSAVKAGAGVVLLAISLIILERMPHLFPPMLTMILWSLLLIVSGVYLGAFSATTNESSGWFKFWKGLGLTFIFYGVLVMIGGLLGGKTVTDPFYGLSLSSHATTTGTRANKSHVQFKHIKSLDELKHEISLARQQGKNVMLDFYADWCTYCKKYDRYVFPDPAVRKFLDKMVLLQADVTATDDTDKKLMGALGISLPPAILFFGKNGKEIPSSRILGEMDADEFSNHLAKFLKQ